MKKNIFIALVCAFFSVAALTQNPTPDAKTNKGQGIRIDNMEYCGFNDLANRFDSVKIEATMNQPKMWTKFHIRMVGANGSYMATNFDGYTATAGKVTRVGNTFNLAPAFEGTTTITLSPEIQSPRLAVREVGQKVPTHFREGYCHL